MKMPFIMDIAKVKGNMGKLYIAIILALVVNISSLVLPSDINTFVVPILGIIIGIICGRSRYDITGNLGSSIAVGIFSAFTLINIFFVLYVLIKNKKVISEYDKSTSYL